MLGENLFDNWDHAKSYKTVERLDKALREIHPNYEECRPLLVSIPTGKNIGRLTVIFPPANGDNLFWVHQGFKVFG